MTLNDVWFFLFILIIAGYLILDGFDMGVGILLLPLARTDIERRTFLNSIGPVWDGNEVWLVLGGGVLFAVFPLAYASLFSGLYLAFAFVLLVLILRTVALEFRSKEESKRWRSAWDTVFAAASAGLALLLGVAFGNIVAGLPVDANGNISSGLIAELTPFSLLVGVTTVAMFAVQGGIYLLIKTEGELHDRIERVMPRLMIVFFLLNTLLVIALAVFHPAISERYSRRHLAGHPPDSGPRRARGGLGLRSAWSAVPRLPGFVRDDRAAAHLGRGRSLPEPHHLDHRSCLQPDDLQCRVSRKHARHHPDLRRDRHPVRAAVHDRRVLHLPGQDRRRHRIATRRPRAR